MQEASTHRVIFTGTVREFRLWLKTWPLALPLSLYLTQFDQQCHHQDTGEWPGWRI